MDSYLLLLLIVIPSASALVNCRTACHTCREGKQHPEVLEVHCAMCQECKERRQEKMLDKASAKSYFREGTSTTESILLTLDPETSHYPKNSKYPETSQYTETSEAEGCPIQTPCSDSDEPVPSPIKQLLLTKTVPPTTTPITTTTPTTTTTTTTTRKPCHTFQPCKMKPNQPPLILPPPPPLPALPPLVPIAPPPLYPVPNCYIPMQMQPMYPCPDNPYMGPPGPMPYGVIAQGFNMIQEKHNHGSGKESYENHGRYTDSKQHEDGYEKHGRYTKVINLHESHENQARYTRRELRESTESHGRYTDSKQTSENSGSAEHQGTSASIVVVQGTPAIMNLKTQTKKDFVYMYVGVPKSILKS